MPRSCQLLVHALWSLNATTVRNVPSLCDGGYDKVVLVTYGKAIVGTKVMHIVFILQYVMGVVGLNVLL